LVQLAHLALVLIGEGEVFYKGERRPTQEVFKLENLKPIQIKIREGLALMNGTSVMTGIGVVNVHHANKLLDWSLKFSCAINEIVQTYDDHFSEELNNTKRHKGQQVVAAIMRANLADSKLIKKREDHLYSGENTENIFKEKVQECSSNFRTCFGYN
jgi:histidine ammonia-lyase